MTRYSELVVREALYSLPVTADYDQARPAESYGLNRPGNPGD